ncbi:dihydrodipicolinate synthase family protein [Dehalococcoidia bacterium]|nr:dihydrodipicolinate synthase family protein [Dehalococcoidia bacterium]
MTFTTSEKNNFPGVHFMLPTPFINGGDIDYSSFNTLISHAVKSGCSGVVTLGVMGEANRMLESERDKVIEYIVNSVNNRIEVIVGVSSDSTIILKSRIRSAQNLGASAIMACPSRLSKPNENAISNYFNAAQETSNIPIVLQDLPTESGVHLSAELISKLCDNFPLIQMLKLEDPPTPPKISSILKTTNKKILVFGGLGGVFFLEELGRGAAGTMTGFAYPEILTSIYKKVISGDLDSARDLFFQWLPLIRYENSAGISLSIRKHIMKFRGLIEDASVREPTPNIDDFTLNELLNLLSSMRLK